LEGSKRGSKHSKEKEVGVERTHSRIEWRKNGTYIEHNLGKGKRRRRKERSRPSQSNIQSYLKVKNEWDPTESAEVMIGGKGGWGT